MLNIFIWLAAFVISLIALILTAASGEAIAHMSIAGVVSLVFAALSIVEERKLRAANVDEKTIASSNARHMGYVWIWGAVGLFVTYQFILSWHEWLTFFLAFAVVGTLCIFFSNILKREVESGNNDETISKIARYLGIAQLVGMIITMIGLVVDGKMQRFINPRHGWEDWAANNFFFFGALALAIISAHALISSPKPDKTNSS